MIAVRKEVDVFSDFNNRELIDVGNDHLFVFERYSISQQFDRVLVVANFNDKPQKLNLDDLVGWGDPQYGQVVDLYSGRRPDIFKNVLVIPPFKFYWLQQQ
jgi:amylosucrase